MQGNIARGLRLTALVGLFGCLLLAGAGNAEAAEAAAADLLAPAAAWAERATVWCSRASLALIGLGLAMSLVRRRRSRGGDRDGGFGRSGRERTPPGLRDAELASRAGRLRLRWPAGSSGGNAAVRSSDCGERSARGGRGGG